jgi:hypothetical protein
MGGVKVSIARDVQRICVYAAVALLIGVPVSRTSAKDDAVSVRPMPKMQFQWKEHTRLSWSDFQGPVTTVQQESAAATCCSIGFRTNTSSDGRTEVEVYNTFYVNKSWVKEDARIQSILDHEQGHFDLCEIYTRKLKQRIAAIDMNADGVKQQLMHIYSEVSSEYEARQQAYELETTHGTVMAEQKRWQQMIADELM